MLANRIVRYRIEKRETRVQWGKGKNIDEIEKRVGSIVLGREAHERSQNWFFGGRFQTETLRDATGAVHRVCGARASTRTWQNFATGLRASVSKMGIRARKTACFSSPAFQVRPAQVTA